MKYVIAMLAVIASGTVAYACTTHTIYSPGGTRICTTCCSYGHCTTTCY